MASFVIACERGTRRLVCQVLEKVTNFMWGDWPDIVTTDILKKERETEMAQTLALKPFLMVS